MVGSAVVADEEALIEVGPSRLVDRGRALDALVDAEVADVVVIDRQTLLCLDRHGVKLARRLECRMDDLGRHAVPGEVEEAHLLTRLPHRARDGLEPAGLAAERRAEVDDGNCSRGLLDVLHRQALEDVQGSPPGRLRPPGGRREHAWRLPSSACRTRYTEMAGVAAIGQMFRRRTSGISSVTSSKTSRPPIERRPGSSWRAGRG